MTHVSNRINERGFTLVELGISIVVIGVLLGGILKGRELIENSKINTAVRQFRAYDASANVFRDTYGALPGDITDPGDRLHKCVAALCNIGGNGNGYVSNQTLGDALHERNNFFPHLTKAGLINGPEGGTQSQLDAGRNELFLEALPFSSSLAGTDPYIHVFYSTPIETAWGAGIMPWPATHVYAIRITGRQAEMLDSKMDDGKPLTGEMREMSGCFTSGGAAAIYDLKDSSGCGVHIKAGF